MSTEITKFPSRSGGEASGPLALPAGEKKAPAVVLLQEWWGVNEHIHSILERLSAAGFVALAPDLFHGKVTKNADEAGKLMATLDRPRAIEEIAGAVAYLRKHPRSNGSVAVMGFCMGGALTFAAATKVAGLAAAVPFYGIPDASTVDYGKVTAPILAHFAARDGWAKPEAAKAIQAELETYGRTMELHVYDADHAFFNDTRPEVYSADDAKLAWERTIAFLRKHLG
jgi:carboxymethylenebutenolidase